MNPFEYCNAINYTKKDIMIDDIAEKAEDTSTLLDNYVEQLNTKLNKDRLKTLMRSLYTEANDIDL